MKIPSSVVYYITAHGYGHGVRSCDIIKALCQTDPDVCLHVVSDLPVEFLRSRLNLPLESYRAGSFDVGMVQRDSIRVDVDHTLRKVISIIAAWPERMEKERKFLREQNAGLVVCDIPSMPIEAAKAEGLSALAVGNFAWDWIYEEFIPRDARWQDAVNAFRFGYRQTDLLLRLPFAEPMKAFPRQQNIPLVSTMGHNHRLEMARSYQIDPGKTWVLLSFSSLDWDDSALKQIESLTEYVFLTVLPLEWPGKNFCAIDRHRFSFSDVIATADLVVSKPGYGILSECVVNNKPLVYAERTDFREYPVLEASLKKYLRFQHIPGEELYRGHLGPYLETIQNNPPALEKMQGGGDRIAAEILLTCLRA